jgi:nucleoside phosphorylase
MDEKQFFEGRAVVLTALPLEYKAIRAHLTYIQEEVYKGTIYERGNFLAEKWHWNVGIAQIGAGNPGAAAEAERAISYFQPDIALFVGIAGGIKDVSIGDVVVSTKVYGYESGKAGEKKFFARPEVGLSSHRLIQRALAEARKERWKQRTQQCIPGDFPSTQVFIGPIAAGEKVLISTRADTFVFLQTTYNDALAIEMEGLGFLQAVQRNEGVQALIVRGISDLLDKKQQSDAQGNQILAACHASAFAFEILARLDYPQITKPASQEEAVGLIDFHVYEQEKAVMLDITLHNSGTKPIFPMRAIIEILDVGEFSGEREEENNPIRSFLEISHIYEVVLAPRAKSQFLTLKLAHLLQPGDADRFQIRMTQNTLIPGIVAVWYHARISIIYNEHGQSVKSTPFLISLPPITEEMQQYWQGAGSSDGAIENRKTLSNMAGLSGLRSESVNTTIQSMLNG